MKFPASLCITSQKNALCFTTPTLLKNLGKENCKEVVVVHVCCDKEASAYLSLMPSRTRNEDKAVMWLNGLYASKLGITDSSDVLIEVLDDVPPCTTVWIEPVSVDDWEILELHANEAEAQLLDQVRVVWPGQVFPFWVDGNVCIFLKTVELEPSSPCGILIPLTELFIEPKVDGSRTVQNTKLNGYTDTNTKTRNTIVDRQFQSEENTKINVGTVEQNQVPTRQSFLYSFVYLKCLCRLFNILKFLTLFLWKQIPDAFVRFHSLMFATDNNALCADPLTEVRGDVDISYNINSLPENFSLTLRVEPAANNTTPTLSACDKLLLDQPSTVYLHSSLDCSSHQYETDVHLVLLSKLLSPSEKATITNTALKKSQQSRNNTSDFAKAKLTTDDSSATEAQSDVKPMQVCVIRMHVNALSKFAMNCDWSALCCTHHLKVPATLRRQMNLTVSSRVRLQKLHSTPNLGRSIKSVNLEIIPSEPPLANTIDISCFLNSFKNWITAISDENNPLPFMKDSLFVFPLLRNELNDTSSSEDCSIVEVLVADIQLRQKSHSYEGTCDAIKRTFLLCGDDLRNIEVNFSYTKQPNAVPSLSEVDIELPMEKLKFYSVGFEHEVDSIVQFVEIALTSRPLPNAFSKFSSGLRSGCLLVCGAKGTGKTTLCRAVLQKFGSDPYICAYVQSVSCGKLRGKKPENIKRHFDNLLSELLWKQPSLLLLDDVDQLIPASGSGDDEKAPDGLYNSQLASVLKNFLQSLAGKHQQGWDHSSRVCVLLTCKSKSFLHPAIASGSSHLYSNVIEIELPTAEKRGVILKSIIKSYIGLQCPTNINTLVEKTEGFAVGDLLGLVRKSCHAVQQNLSLSQKDRKHEEVQDSSIVNVAFNESLSGFTPASLQNAKLHKPSPLTWKQVGGLVQVKQKLIEQLIWPIKYKELFTSSGIQAQSGVLLFGPPGCGKTLIAGVVANECGLNFISIKGPEVLSKYIGASEAAVRDLFSRAKAAAPCVLFFDEFDSLAPPRGHDSTGVTDRVVNQLLTHLDGVEPLVGVTVMAASSRPDLLDPALLRPGRLDNLLYCPLPNKDERYEILISLSEKLPLHDSVDLGEFAGLTKNFSGADLKALLYNAQLEAAHETFDGITKKDKTLAGITYKELPATSSSGASMSSSSTLSSKPDMEVDDLYSNNGFSSLDESDEAIQSSNLDDFIGELKETAAELIESVQHNKALNNQSLHSSTNDYQICFEEPLQNKNSKISLKKAGKKQESAISPLDMVYFPCVSHGRSYDLPSDVTRLTNIMDHSASTYSVSQVKCNSDVQSLPFIITANHIRRALTSTQPSLSSKQRNDLEKLYSKFVRSREKGNMTKKDYYEGTPRATLS